MGRASAPDSATNIGQRDYLQVEKDAWAARRQIGNVPVAVVTVKFSAVAISESPFPAEKSDGAECATPARLARS